MLLYTKIFLFLMHGSPCTLHSQHLQKTGENHLVLVVDDDTHYPPKLLETLLDWHAIFPNAALAFRGWVVHKEIVYLSNGDNYLVFGNEVRLLHRTSPWVTLTQDATLHSMVSPFLQIYAPHPVSVVTGNCGYLGKSLTLCTKT